MLGRGDGFGGGSAAAPERVQVELVSANPTGRSRWPRPAMRPMGTRSRGCSRLRATRSSGSTTTTTRVYRWTSSAPRSKQPGEGRRRLRAATRVRTLRIWPGDRRSGPPHARADRGCARAVPRPVRHVRAPERRLPSRQAINNIKPWAHYSGHSSLVSSLARSPNFSCRKRSRWLYYHHSARHRGRIRWHLDRTADLGFELPRRVDSLDPRRDVAPLDLPDDYRQADLMA